MNKKEINEIKKQFRIENVNITRIASSYVRTNGEVQMLRIAPFLSLPEDEALKYLAIFRKCLSKSNSLFSLKCDSASECMGNMEELRKSLLVNGKQIERYISRIAESYISDQDYLVLLAHGTYDIPGDVEDALVYEYLFTVICPMELSESALAYDAVEARITERSRDRIVKDPVQAILYPAFSDRREDVNHVWYYAKNPENKQDLFLGNLLNVLSPCSAKEESKWFRDAFEQMPDPGTLEQTCAMQEKITERVLEHIGQTVEVDLPDFQHFMEACNMTAEQVDYLNAQFTEKFGEKGKLVLEHLMDPKKVTIESGYISLKLDPDYLSHLETKRIDGRLHLVLPLSENTLRLNGASVKLAPLLMEE